MTRRNAALPGSVERRSEARRLTDMLEASDSFTYLRLGDGELQLLLEWQSGNEPRAVRKSASSLKSAYSVNGLCGTDYARLQRVFERCSYLDTFERVPHSRENFRHLKLASDPAQVRSPCPALSQIFYEWVFLEFPNYISRHRCVIAGAESLLLKELLRNPQYRSATGSYWQGADNVACVPVRNNGRDYWELLPEIKADLIVAIREQNADTLFLSLASGAKILCQEISEELCIRCFDLGALMLAMTYSATPGNSLARNSHNPFFHRVPFEVYMDALAKSAPGLSVHDLVVKAQAQLALELLRKEPMNSFVPEVSDHKSFHPTIENVRSFEAAERIYYSRFAAFLSTDAGQQLTSQFNDWCITFGLGRYGTWTRKIVMTWLAIVNRIAPTSVPPHSYLDVPAKAIKLPGRVLRKARRLITQN